MVWLVEGIYIGVMVFGLIWLTLRIMKFARSGRSSKRSRGPVVRIVF